MGQLGGNRSAPRSFTTALQPGDATPFRFALFGDMALSPWPGAWSTVSDIAWDNEHGDGATGGGIRFVAHSGDLGYAMGSQAIWALWHTIIEPASGTIPYMVLVPGEGGPGAELCQRRTDPPRRRTIGNHEYDHESCQATYRDPSGAPVGGFHPTWGDYGDDSSGEGGVVSGMCVLIGSAHARRWHASLLALSAAAHGRSLPRPYERERPLLVL